MGNGSGTSSNVHAPVLVGGLSGWTDVSLGQSFSCGIETGQLYCWGSDYWDAMADGSGNSGGYDIPNPIGGSTTWTQIASGESHACGIYNGALYCWGRNYEAQTGIGFGSARVGSINQVESSVLWTNISVGEYHSCGVNNNLLYCWGKNTQGEVGLGSKSNVQALPAQVSNLTGWTQLDLGGSFSCGIESGQLYCWGSDGEGKLGNGSLVTSNVLTPTRIGQSSSWTYVTAGHNHACGVDDQKLYCWGSDGIGQTANSNASSPTFPEPESVSTATAWTQVVVGADHSCGIKAQHLYCWGDDKEGQLGDGSGVGNYVLNPQRIWSSELWTDLALGDRYTCGISAGRLFCWGRNDSGQIGRDDGLSDKQSSPFQVDSSTAWTHISTGQRHVCGIKAGALYCWGDDNEGQLGNGNASSVDTDVPTRVGSSQLWTQISAGGNHTCGLQGGLLYCWGDDLYGQIGNNSSSSVAVHDPELIGSANDWSSVHVGGFHSCGSRGGSVHCWGRNNVGQLGNGLGNSNVHLPTQLVGFTDINPFAVGGGHSCSIKAGELFCWGGDEREQLGDGSGKTDQYSPVKIGSSTQWSHVSLGTEHSCGIQSGRLFCWGSNSDYQSGTSSSHLESPFLVLD